MCFAGRIVEKSTFERILAFEPNDPVTKSAHAFVELDSKADTRPLHEVIDSIRDETPAALSSVADNWLLCAFAERDRAAARKALTALGENPASSRSGRRRESQSPIYGRGDTPLSRRTMLGLRPRLHGCTRRAREKLFRPNPITARALCVLGLDRLPVFGSQKRGTRLREGRLTQ